MTHDDYMVAILALGSIAATLFIGLPLIQDMIPMSNCKHFPNADDTCLVCAANENDPLVRFQEDIEAEAAGFPFWTVAIYLCDRAYGGAEEGGWWYDTGVRVDDVLEGVNPNALLTVFTGQGTVYRDKGTGDEFKSAAEQEAYAYAAQLQTLLDVTVNVGRREISSVLSTGRYYAEAHPGYPPSHYPAQTPHYE